MLHRLKCPSPLPLLLAILLLFTTVVVSADWTIQSVYGRQFTIGVSHGVFRLSLAKADSAPTGASIGWTVRPRLGLLPYWYSSGVQYLTVVEIPVIYVVLLVLLLLARLKANRAESALPPKV